MTRGAGLRDRVDGVVETPVGPRTVAHFGRPHQKWYRDRGDVLGELESSGSCVVSAGSVDMGELLRLCEENGWSMAQEAGEVFAVEAGGGEG